MSSIKYKLISVSAAQINDMINVIPDAPKELRNFLITAAILTNKYNEYGLDLYTFLMLIFKNEYYKIEEILKMKTIQNYICVFIVEENTNNIIGTMTLNDNVIGTITIFPEYRNKGIATTILTSMFNKANELNIEIQIYPNHDLLSIVKKIGFTYFPCNEESYAFNKFGNKSRLDRFISKIIYQDRSQIIVLNRRDIQGFYDVIGFNSLSVLNLLRCSCMLDTSNKTVDCLIESLIDGTSDI